MRKSHRGRREKLNDIFLCMRRTMTFGETAHNNSFIFSNSPSIFHPTLFVSATHCLPSAFLPRFVISFFIKHKIWMWIICHIFHLFLRFSPSFLSLSSFFSINIICISHTEKVYKYTRWFNMIRNKQANENIWLTIHKKWLKFIIAGKKGIVQQWKSTKRANNKIGEYVYGNSRR